MPSRKLSISKSVSNMGKNNNMLVILGIVLLIAIVIYFIYLENKKEKESFTATYRALYGQNNNGYGGSQSISGSNTQGHFKLGRVGISNSDNSKAVGCRGLRIQGYNSYGRGCCGGYNNETGVAKGRCCVEVDGNRNCVKFEGNY